MTTNTSRAQRPFGTFQNFQSTGIAPIKDLHLPLLIKDFLWSDIAAGSHLVAASPVITPVQSVFSTWELCGNILRHLPCTDLVRARRVNSKMKAILDQTSSLQQAMFIKPRTKHSIWGVSSSEKLLAGPDVLRLMHIEAAKGEVVTFKPVFELHPALAIQHGLNCTTRRQSAFKSFAELDRKCIVAFQNDKPIASTPIRSGLNKMFLSQPPVKEVRIEIMLILNIHLAEVAVFDSFVIHNNIGVTFGQLLQSVRAFIAQDWRRAYKFSIRMTFPGGLPVYARDKQIVEDAGVLTWPQWVSDPFGIIEVDEQGHPVDDGSVVTKWGP